MLTRIRRASALALALCLLLGVSLVLPVEVKAAKTPEAAIVTPDTLISELPVNYQQGDARWGAKEKLAQGGCGLLSLVNAVHFLTGSFIEPVGLAQYAHSIDAYYGSVGGGTARWVLYNQLQDYEKEFGFRVVNTGRTAGAKDPVLLEHLAKGGTAVAHVKGHFIALCGYDEESDTILVYDCAATPDRATTVEPCWKSTDFLSTHARMTVDWWCLLEKTETTTVTTSEGETAAWGLPTSTFRYGKGQGGSCTLTGRLEHSRPLDTFFYVVDYDYEHVYETGLELGGVTELDFSVSPDLDALPLGSHTLRLSARTTDGGVVDVCEYAVFISDGKDGYDPEVGCLTINMTNYVGHKSVRDNLASTGKGVTVFRSSCDEVLYLGDMDLSKYTAVVVVYSAKEGFFECTNREQPAMVGLRDNASSFGSMGATPNMYHTLAYGEPTPTTDDSYKIIRTMTIDLSECDYSGDVYFSVYHPSRQYLMLRELRFYEGEIPPETEAPATETPTEAPTESPATGEGAATAPADPTATGDAEAPTAVPTGTAPADGGCAATLPAAALLSLLPAAALALRRRRA